MKKRIPTIFRTLCILGATTLAAIGNAAVSTAKNTTEKNAAVTVLDSAPVENVIVNQAETAAPDAEQPGIQARWINDTDFRGVTQTFLWQGGEGGEGTFSALGVRISPEKNPKIQYKQPQRFTLDVQELNPRQTVARTLASVGFTLVPEMAQPGKYLLIRLPGPVKMNDGGRYGFYIRPDEKNPGNRVAFATNGKDAGDGFPNGAAAQTNAPGLLAAGVRYGRSPMNFDVTFFLQK
ncbi:MAG: hypothetical protein LBK99_11920 [Opitutaceae bacterium]|nr:hypothetical protein [Opitutaceae bacterium]